MINKKKIVVAIISALMSWPHSALSKELSVLINDKSNALSNLDLRNATSLHNHFFKHEKTRADIVDLEERVKAQSWCLDTNPHEIFHSFADGMYKREMHIKAGHIIVGKIHRNEYFINVSKGSIWLTSEYYNKKIIAPCSFTAPPGAKHIGYTLEDTVWSDTHKVTTTDIEQAEKEIFVNSYEELDALNNVIDGEYEAMLTDIEITAEQARLCSEIQTDMIDLDDKYMQHLVVKDSDIEGLGVFCLKDFSEDDVIGEARVDNNRTILGRYVNHSDNPNTKATLTDNKAIIMAAKDINNGDELTMNYRESRRLAKELDRGVS